MLLALVSSAIVADNTHEEQRRQAMPVNETRPTRDDEPLAREAAGGDMPTTGASDDDDYAQMTKKELYEKAKTLNVAGRGHMTRAELIEALNESSQPRSALGRRPSEEHAPSP
jgi:hypothetical protein